MNMFPTNVHLGEGGLTVNLGPNLCGYKGVLAPVSYWSPFSVSVTTSGARAPTRAVTSKVPGEALHGNRTKGSRRTSEEGCPSRGDTWGRSPWQVSH